MAILSYPSLQVETLVGVKRTGTLKSSIYCTYGIQICYIYFFYIFIANIWQQPCPTSLLKAHRQVYASGAWVSQLMDIQDPNMYL